jgi:beta-aspartyl-peptidase (threonine type)
MDLLHREELSLLRVTATQRMEKEKRSDGRYPVLRLFGVVAGMALLGAAGCSPVPEAESTAQEPVVDREAEAARIVEMLHASAESWNAGDLDGFMDDYWNDPDLTFSGSAGVTRGWNGVRERYLRTYWAPGAARDSLRFEELEVRMLGDAQALVLGRYVLHRPEAGTTSATGFFSLVLWKRADGWKIVHDHTSAEDPPEGS